MKKRDLLITSLGCLVVLTYLLYEFDVFEKVFSRGSGEVNIVEEHEENLEETENIIQEERKEKEDGAITKDELVLLIFSSTLHFDNVEGEYTLTNPLKDKKDEVSFALDMVGEQGMIKQMGDTINKTLFFSADPQEKVSLDEQDKTYRRIIWKEDLEKDQEQVTDTAELFSTGGMGADPRIKMNFVLGDMINSKFVESMKYYEQWEMEETTYLDMESYEIQGNDSFYYEGDTFEMIVEKNTGIVLDYTVFDENNNEIISLTTSSIRIDQGVDQEIFTPDLTDYEKGEIPDIPEEDKDDNVLHE